MDFKNKPSFEKIQFYKTTEYNCSYINKMDAQSLVVTPYKSIGLRINPYKFYINPYESVSTRKPLYKSYINPYESVGFHINPYKSV